MLRRQRTTEFKESEVPTLYRKIYAINKSLQIRCKKLQNNELDDTHLQFLLS